jgi:hypothetical protein
MTRGSLLFVVATLAVAPTACGGDLTALEGVYTISTWTQNDTGCASEGPSVLADMQDTHLFVKADKFFGEEWVSVGLCADAADCEMRLGDDDTIDLSGYIFDSGSDDSGWRGASYFGTRDPDGNCDGTLEENTLTSPGDGQVRIETRSTPVAGFAPDADDFCTVENAQAAKGDAACAELEVLTAGG